jgi:hypothetical protein
MDEGLLTQTSRPYCATRHPRLPPSLNLRRPCHGVYTARERDCDGFGRRGTQLVAQEALHCLIHRVPRHRRHRLGAGFELVV